MSYTPTTPTWENWDSARNRWVVLPASTAALLETAFRDPSVTTTIIAGLTFDVDKMQYPLHNPVRRGKCDASQACMYHDDHAFMNLDPWASTLILDAQNYGRSYTSFYVKDVGAYDVSLAEPATQTNRISGKNRALYIPTMPKIAITGDDDDDDDDDVDVDRQVFDSMPECLSKPLMCPITTEIMRKPVVASDGHTYERSAIVRWLTSKNTSPLTLKPMEDQSLRVNHNIKQIIDALKPEPEPSVAPASQGKRKMGAGSKKKAKMSGP